MIRSAALSFPATVYEPPPESNWGTPALSLNLGSVNVNLGGTGTGVYRKAGGSEGAVVQTEGIRDGVRTLMGKVRQGVDRIGIP